MPTWSITTTSPAGSSLDSVTAEYFTQTDDGQFVQFKDDNHKVVYMVAAKHLATVTRAVESRREVYTP